MAFPLGLFGFLFHPQTPRRTSSLEKERTIRTPHAQVLAIATTKTQNAKDTKQPPTTLSLSIGGVANPSDALLTRLLPSRITVTVSTVVLSQNQTTPEAAIRKPSYLPP
jgi:hypothetical protein